MMYSKDAFINNLLLGHLSSLLLQFSALIFSE
jgi:hypothetical protein